MRRNVIAMDCGTAIIISTGFAFSTALVIAGKPDFQVVGALLIAFAAAGFYYGLTVVRFRG